MQILREINFGQSRTPKKAIFCHFRGSVFCYFGKFQPSKGAKIHKKHNSEPLNVLKWQIMYF